ncbi:hypothetical protein CPLU01_15402 [Colletotrichum plurivorum]|uniref:Uncharacterized protein n=1 Tax=Colletotrichum plurivorum TaxID=2175906 RepID=A0A8H6MVS7_9PEZI|nr:hypothetical protein CPLU01_15402 [Colletotrichum plurivorum]
MKLLSALILLASAGAVVAENPASNAGNLAPRDIDLDATKTNPRVKRADGTWNLIPKRSETKAVDRRSDGAQPAQEKKREAEGPTKTNPRIKRADGTWNLVPRASETKE